MSVRGYIDIERGRVLSRHTNALTVRTRGDTGRTEAHPHA